MSAAAALGDAGSPASDTTLGPTSGLNADGQHDHIWDTCVPTFIAFNIPLMIAAVIVSQFISGISGPDSLRERKFLSSIP